MTKPSRGAAIFLFLFGLPFFAFGSFMVFGLLTSSPAVHHNGNPMLGALFASVFALVGLGIMAAGVFGYRHLKKQAALEQANPGSPWLWRRDWAESRAISQNRNTVYGWWIGTLFVGMIVVPIAVSVLPSLLSNSDPKAFLVLGFCLIPAILFAGALRATIRRERYGKTYLEFASLPFTPGKRLTGQIHLRLDTAVKHGIDLRLSCIRRIVTGSGKSQSTSDIALWQNQKNVPQNSVIFGPLGTSIPVDFEIPEDAYETNHDQLRDQVLWMLHAEADVPGVDYCDDFEIPVFRLAPRAARASASAGFAESALALGSGFATAASMDSDSAELPPPPNPKVVVSITPEGATEFYFPAFRNRGRTLLLLLFTAIWTGVVYFLAYSTTPVFFAALFGFFDLLLIYGCLQGLFGTARIIVGNGKVISRKATFGKGTPREIPVSDIQSIQAAVGIQQGTTASNASCMIRLNSKSGRHLTLADGIADQREARWVVAQMEKLAGLKPDTRVVLQNFGRDLGPPPQRSSF